MNAPLVKLTELNKEVKKHLHLTCNWNKMKTEQMM